ncbi:unnamed protein product [Danaus chrysippus]|uniref:(African queen) hypothetical protein n=1 Tax=Danaus chrysippus TaxID=151541 RepID=A0A8J2R915_9NEOP|nr:unnamed protein product [Danaus chrysippus]
MIVGATTATTLYGPLRQSTSLYSSTDRIRPRLLTVLLIMLSVLRDGLMADGQHGTDTSEDERTERGSIDGHTAPHDEDDGDRRRAETSSRTGRRACQWRRR